MTCPEFYGFWNKSKLVCQWGPPLFLVPDSLFFSLYSLISLPVRLSLSNFLSYFSISFSANRDCTTTITHLYGELICHHHHHLKTFPITISNPGQGRSIPQWQRPLFISFPWRTPMSFHHRWRGKPRDTFFFLPFVVYDHIYARNGWYGDVRMQM